MSTRPLDSTASISPLDVLLAPAPRENAADGTFAQHFATQNNTPKPRTEETASSRTQPERRDTKEQRDAQGAPPVASHSKTEPKARDDQDAAPAADAEGDRDRSPQPPVVEQASDTTPPIINDEAEETDNQASPVDELLLTDVVPAVQIVKPETPAVAEQAAEQANPTAVAAIAEESGDAETKTAAPITQKSAPVQPTVALDNAAEQPADAVSKDAALAPNASDSAAVASDTASIVVEQTIEAATAPPIVVDTPVVASSDKPTKRGAKGDGQQASTEEQVAATEATENVSAASVNEVDQATEKPRESKRDRQRSEGRNSLTDKPAPSEVTTTSPATTAPASADAAGTTLTATNAAPAARAPVDIAVPPPVTAGQSTTPTTGGAPQSLQRLPQHLLARSTTQGSGGAPPNPAEQARFVARVAKAFQTAHARGGELQLRLSPAELGSLKLEIKLQDGVMSARVEAESVHAKNLLIDNLPVLKERLAEQGIVVEKFDVELMDRQPQGQPDTAHERERRHLPRNSFIPKPDEATAKTAAASEPRAPRSDGRLNVTV